MIKYDLIFYLSKKTGYCEKKLKKTLSPIGFELNRILYSTNPVDLGTLTCESLSLTKLVVLIGGLSEMGDDNLATILSRVLSSANLTLKNARKLKSDKETGYVVNYKGQTLLALPDNPDDIEQMLNNDFLEFLKKQ